MSTYTLLHPVVTVSPTTNAQWHKIGDIIDTYPQRPQAGLTLTTGTWLLSLGENLYRLANGHLVCIDEPIAQIASPLTDPQANQALRSFRTLREIARDQYGLSFDETCHGLPPFKMLKCPLCWGTVFTSMDFTAVYCDTCNASFTTSYTAGDPGWVVDCHWPYYSHHHSYYIMPHWQEAHLRLVCKNNGDPWAMNTDDCYGDTCQHSPKLTTDQAPNLRAGLHECQLGDIYGWSLGGYAPVTGNYPYDIRTRAYLYRPGKDEPETWSPYLAISGLNREDRDLLQQIKRYLGELKDGLDLSNPDNQRKQESLVADQQHLQVLYDQPRDVPLIYYRTTLPPVPLLAEGEKYLLYRWALRQSAGEQYYAEPIWRIVTERSSENRYTAQRCYDIVDKNICLG